MPNPWKLTTLALTAALALNLAAPASADRQPRMRDALGHLHAAERSLEHASSDKGGHRVKALSLVRSAIAEVQQGIKHDNRR